MRRSWGSWGWGVCLFITRMRPIRSWRGYIESVPCPLSAQWRLVASSPFALRPGLSQEDVMRTKEAYKRKENERERQRKRRKKGVPPLHRSRSQLPQELQQLRLRHLADCILLSQHPPSHIRGGEKV